MRLREGWDTFWSTISSGQITLWMSVAGALVIVIAIVMFLHKQKSGQGASWRSLGWALMVGGVLAAPGVMIPALLGVAEVIINVAASLMTRAGK